MRRTARRLGRLERNAGLLALTGSVCFASAGASAAPAPDLFRLTIVGTAHQEWDHTSAPVESEGCLRSVRSEGERSVRFRTTRPTLVRVVSGRVLRAELRHFAGTVAFTGPNTVNKVCGTTETHTAQPCAKTSRSFNSGTATVASPRRGTIALGPIGNVRLGRIECPDQPSDVMVAPLGPVPSPLRISVATLTKKRFSRITLSASASRRKNYGAPEKGTSVQRSKWTFTFVRVEP